MKESERQEERTSIDSYHCFFSEGSAHILHSIYRQQYKHIPLFSCLWSSCERIRIEHKQHRETPAAYQVHQKLQSLSWSRRERRLFPIQSCSGPRERHFFGCLTWLSSPFNPLHDESNDLPDVTNEALTHALVILYLFSSSDSSTSIVGASSSCFSSLICDNILLIWRDIALHVDIRV